MKHLFIILFLFASCQDTSVLEPGESQVETTTDSEVISTYDEENAPFGSYLNNELTITEALSEIEKKTILNPLILNNSEVQVGDTMAVAIGKLQAQVSSAGTTSNAILNLGLNPTNTPLINSFGVYSGTEEEDLGIEFFNNSGINFLIGNKIAGSFTENKIEFFSDVYTNGNVYSLSDRRVKKNVRPISNAENILKIDAVSFKWTNSNLSDFGVIAQNVQEYFPEAVAVDGSGNKRVSYAKLIAPLLEVVKRQQKEIEKLKEAIAK